MTCNIEYCIQRGYRPNKEMKYDKFKKQVCIKAQVQGSALLHCTVLYCNVLHYTVRVRVRTWTMPPPGSVSNRSFKLRFSASF